jgi:hypothetical protein
MDTARNSAGKSGAKSRASRPDYCLWLRRALALKGESRRGQDGLDVAASEVVDKMHGWNPVTLRGLPLLPCYALGGTMLQYYCIMPLTVPGGALTSVAVTDVLDLSLRVRSHAVKVALNMLRALRDTLHAPPLPLYKTVAREPAGTSIMIMTTTLSKSACRFLKTYKPA